MQSIHLLIVFLFIIQIKSLPIKTIDGNINDWISGEWFQGGDNSEWGVSWNNDVRKLSFVVRTSFLSINSRSIAIFMSSNPLPNPLASNGTTRGPTFNTQTPKLPFKSQYLIRFNGSGLITYEYNTQWNVISTNGEAVQRGNIVELSIGLFHFKNPTSIYVSGCIIDETPFSEFAMASFPNSFSMGYYPNITWGTFYGFPLLSSEISPNLKTIDGEEIFKDTFITQSINSSGWANPSTWTLGFIPTTLLIACICGSQVTVNSNVEAKHILIDSGASLIQSPNTRISLSGSDAFFLNYGSFESSGIVSPNSKIDTKGTVNEFFDIELKGRGVLGNVTVRNSLAMQLFSFIQGTNINYVEFSTLEYRTSYDRYLEWTQPHHVRISQASNVRILNSGLPDNVSLDIMGDLTIDSGSSVSLLGYKGNLTIGGNLNNYGSISLSRVPNNSIYVSGNITSIGDVVCGSVNTIYDSQNLRFNSPIIDIVEEINGKFHLRALPSPLAPTILSYNWNTGETSPNITVNQGNYYVTITTPGSCVATSAISVLYSTTGIVTTSFIRRAITTSINTISSDQNDQPSNNNRNLVGIIVGGTIAEIFLIVVLVVLIWLRKSRKKHSNEKVIMKEMGESEESSVRISVDLYGTKKQVLKRGVTIMETIGEGQFGKVYRGTFNATVVALKEIISQDGKIVDKEADILTGLNHPNIVRFYGVFETQVSSLLVFEFVNGGALNKLLQTEPMTVPSLRTICAQIASGMSYLADHQIVHGDLAARNILVHRDGNSVLVKISDFGLAKVVTENFYKLSDRIIPIKWSAPEKSDIWSFGVVIWEIFSNGIIPYPGLNNADVAKIVIEGKVMDPPEKCPKDIVKLMRSCWKMNPEDRPTFSHLVEKLTDGVKLRTLRIGLNSTLEDLNKEIVQSV